MRALLDVNVLIALTDANHAFHNAAKHWIVEHGESGWATCPLTQNGCIRILSQPGYPAPLRLPDALARLARMCAAAAHEFWPDDVSLLDASVANHAHIHGPRQITDLYLLALAVEHSGRLVTFDAPIPLSAIRGAQKKHLAVI
ncbi:MAG: TA system VapC family ribonuclease toxin [Burkholderiales bacterium]